MGEGRAGRGGLPPAARYKSQQRFDKFRVRKNTTHPVWAVAVAEAMPQAPRPPPHVSTRPGGCSSLQVNMMMAAATADHEARALARAMCATFVASGFAFPLFR